MNTIDRKKVLIISAVVALIVVVAGVIYVTAYKNRVPEFEAYRSSQFTFEFPSGYSVEEFGSSAVSIGSTTGDTFSPFVEIVRYRNDPDVARPASFQAYITQQALALCGSDGPDAIACSDPQFATTTTDSGLTGQQLSLTLTRTNLTNNSVATSTYGPIYVFNTTDAPDPKDDDPLRYEAHFIYPSLSSVLGNTADPDLLARVARTFHMEDGVSDVQ